MKIPELLSDIYRLLLDGRRSAASDLLVEFIYSNQDECKGLNFGQLGNLSVGSPEEIVFRLRAKLMECGLFTLTSKPASKSIDPHNLDDDDLEFIDSVTIEYHARSELYTYDEEETVEPFRPQLTIPHENSVQLTDRHELMPLPPLISEEDGDDDELDEYLDDDVEDDFSTEVYDPTAYDEHLPDSTDDDDDFSGVDSNTGAIEPLDELDLQADDSLIVGNLIDDSVDDYFDFDEDDVSSDDDRFRGEFEDVDTDGAVSHEERARQIALQVGISFGWGHSGVDLLADVFCDHGWGQARIAIERLYENGTSEDELRLIYEIKALWSESEVYPQAFLKTNNRTGYCTYQGGRVLSWVMAAKIAQIIPNGDICEFEYFLDKAFDAWYEGLAIRRRFPVFLNFIKHIVTWYDPERWLPGGMFLDEATADDFDYEIEKDQPYTHLYQNLEDFGLIPRHSKFNC